MPGAAVTAQATPQPPAVAAPVLHWGRCPAQAFEAAQCASLEVPLDYAKPTGRTIRLELSRNPHHSSVAQYKGVILVNPGGPGASALNTVSLQDDIPRGVGEDYDWVSWDPRGVGASSPSLSCRRHYFAAPRRSYTPSTHALREYWTKRSKAYAAACERKHPQLLAHLTTADSARDMDRIRQALGVQRISYYGFSYGTYLGQVYATLFGDHLKRVVLDSNVNPHRVWYRANLDQDRAFDRNIRIWFRWVARYDDVYGLGGSGKAVRHRYYRELRRLAHHPAGKLGAAEWVDAFQNAAYYQGSWEDVASAWRSFARHGHTSGLLGEYRDAQSPGDDNSYAVYNAVQCTDAHWPTNQRRVNRDNKRYNAKYPFMTWSNAWFNAPCLFWPAPAHAPVHVNGSTTSSALLVDETLDAATPYQGSLAVRKLFPQSRLLAEPGGTSHADSLSGDACVDDRIAAYLRSGTLPKRRSGNRADVTCAPLPKPDPRHDGGGMATAFQLHRSGR